jgi:hypothetical protein
LGLKDIVQLAPTISYRDALREMLQADGLLLFQASMCNHQIPAKLYEYLRAGRPIFTLTDPTGNTASSLRAAHAMDIVNIADVASITHGLRRFLGRLREGTFRGVARDVANLHSRRARTRELAALLSQVVEGNPSSHRQPNLI